MVVTDQALKKAAEERALLIAAETAAREASEMKTAFVTNISHEIRTPITCIIGIAELLLGDDTLTKEQRRLVSTALQSSQTLLDLVGMVLVGDLVLSAFVVSRSHVGCRSTRGWQG
jgi:signal transduction histidine kinase